MMRHKNHYLSKIPVGWILLFIGNILLVMAMEVLLLYTAPLPLTAEDLAKSDSRFEEAVLTQTQQRGYLTAALAQTPDGNVYLIPVRRHGIVYSRGQVLKKQILPVEKNTDSTVNVKIGVYTSTLSVSPEPPVWLEDPEPAELYLSIEHSSGASGSSMAVLYMVIGAVLTFLELALIQLIKGN